MPKFIGCGPSIDQIPDGDPRKAERVSMSQVRALRRALGRKPRGFVTVDCSDRGGPRQLAKRWYVRYVLHADLIEARDGLRRDTVIHRMACAIADGAA